MKTVNINIRIIRALAQAAPKADTRYCLNGVLVEVRPEGVYYVATNGHMLAVVHEKHQPNDKIPESFEVIIPRAAATKLKPAKGFKKTELLAVMTYDQDGGGGGKIENTAAAEGILFKPIDGKFPDWRRVVPTVINPKGDTSNCNPEYLATLQDVARDAFNNDDIYIQVFPDGDSVALVLCKDARFVGVIAPLRVTGDLSEVPEWVGQMNSTPKVRVAA